MSEDIIKRSDAIKAIWGDDINPNEDGMVFEAQSHIDRDIRLIPSADRPQEWLPCSERMPEESGTYIVSGKWESGKREVGECEYDTEDGYFDANWNFNIEAWRPYPEPWKGADDE